jgi:hypothetical protein
MRQRETKQQQAGKKNGFQTPGELATAAPLNEKIHERQINRKRWLGKESFTAT